ncbi:MAG: ferrous iron transport protein A [Deltaproteobacteria bacterium]|nr:ferrous iron transport protein A [Deltaproteobacteria bacterium]
MALLPTTTLDAVAPGEQVTILTLRGEGAVTQRLAEMGMVPGAHLTVVRYAPMGDPLEISLHGYHLSLRRREAALVEVSRCR